MIQSILVGVEKGINLDCVLDYAFQLGRALGAQVHGLHVIDYRKIYSPYLKESFYAPSLPGVATLTDIEEVFRERVGKRAQELKEHYQRRMEEFEVAGTFTIEEGDVSDLLSKKAHSHDLMVIGTKGEHLSIPEIILGSTFKSLMGSVNRPILFIPEGCKKFVITRILVAYDGSNAASNALTAAAQMAENFGFELEVVVVDCGDADEAKGALSEAVSYLEKHDVVFHGNILKGAAGEEILDYAQQKKCDLIALGAMTPGIGGMLATLFNASFSQKILECTAVPTLVMR